MTDGTQVTDMNCVAIRYLQGENLGRVGLYELVNCRIRPFPRKSSIQVEKIRMGRRFKWTLLANGPTPRPVPGERFRLPFHCAKHRPGGPGGHGPQLPFRQRLESHLSALLQRQFKNIGGHFYHSERYSATIILYSS